jgi:hypothetical protein
LGQAPMAVSQVILSGWNLGTNIRKLCLCFALDRNERFKALKTLKRMNISSTVLFPGLDGFARSLGEELPFYDEIYGRVEVDDD